MFDLLYGGEGACLPLYVYSGLTCDLCGEKGEAFFTVKEKGKNVEQGFPSIYSVYLVFCTQDIFT